MADSKEPVTAESLEAKLKENETATQYWLQYAKHWETNDEVNALSVYNDGVRKCPHINLWKAYINYCKRCATVKGVVAIFGAALQVVKDDHRVGPLLQEYIALLKAVWNFQVMSRGEIDFEEDPADQGGEVPKDPKDGTVNISNPSCPDSALPEEWMSKSLPLSPEEEELLKWVNKKAPSDAYISVKKRLSLRSIRQLLRQACLTPHDRVDKMMRSFELVEDTLSGTKGAIQANHGADGKQVYDALPNVKAVYERLINEYRYVDTMAVPSEGATLSVTSKTQSKPSVAMKWMDTVGGYRNILAYERSNPLRLEVSDYQMRVSFLYQNCLLVCGCFSEFWYAFFSFVYTFSPLKSLQILKIGVEQLPHDVFLRLAYISTFEDFLYNKNFSVQLMAHLFNKTGEGMSSSTVHETLQAFDPENFQELLKEMDLLGKAGNKEDTSKDDFKLQLVSGLFEQLLNDATSLALAPEQFSLILIHYLNYVRRHTSIQKWRAFFLKNVLCKYSSSQLTWELYASVAQAEYHCCGDKARCAQIYKLALDKFRTAQNFEPYLVMSFVNFLCSVNEVSQAKEELVLAIQRLYELQNDMHNSKKLQQGYKFLFEKLVKLEQLYGNESVTKLLSYKNSLLLQNTSLGGSADTLTLQDQKTTLLGMNLDDDSELHEKSLKLDAFLNQSLTSLLHVNAKAEESEDPYLQQKGKGKKGKKGGHTIGNVINVGEDPFRSEKPVESGFHLDKDYNRPKFLRANLLSSLQNASSSFMSCSSILPFGESLSRFRFQQLAPITNKLNSTRSVRRSMLEASLKQPASSPQQQEPDLGGMSRIESCESVVEPQAPVTTQSLLESAGFKEDGNENLGLLMKRQLLREFADDSDEEFREEFREEEEVKRTSKSQVRVVRPDVTRMATFQPTNAVLIPDANRKGLGSVQNILPKCLVDLQMMLPTKQNLRGSNPDIDYLMSVLQSVTIPQIPMDAFLKEGDSTSRIGMGKSGLKNKNLFGGGAAQMLDSDLAYMNSVGGSVHNFGVEGTFDDGRFQRNSAVAASGFRRKNLNEEEDVEGTVKQESLAMQAIRERTNLKRRKVLKAEEEAE